MTPSPALNLPRVGLAAAVHAEGGVEDVGPPAAIDLQIALRNAFVFETAFLQKGAGCLVFRQAGGLDPAQIETLERMMHDAFDRFLHIALPRIRLADPVAQRARLRGATADIVERDRAQQVLILPPDQKERHRRTVADGSLRPVDPVGESLARQMIRRPDRLPRDQEIRRLPPKAAPRAKVAQDRLPQCHAFSLDLELPAWQEHQAARLSCNASNVGAPSTGP